MTSPVDTRTAPTPDELVAALTTMVGDPDYPCLGARSVFNRERATISVFDELGTAATARQLRRELGRFAATTDLSAGFASFISVFRGPRTRGERDFERLLWKQLQELHDADGAGWAPDVSHEPSDPHFAFSVGGTAYFVVGLHPLASRLARRSPSPVLVFNLHQQFEDMRRSEQYPRMRDTIRRRDAKLQGSVNPMVADHGAGSEARQYAGRQVGEGWRAPFVP